MKDSRQFLHYLLFATLVLVYTGCNRSEHSFIAQAPTSKVEGKIPSSIGKVKVRKNIEILPDEYEEDNNLKVLKQYSWDNDRYAIDTLYLYYKLQNINPKKAEALISSLPYYFSVQELKDVQFKFLAALRENTRKKIKTIQNMWDLHESKSKVKNLLFKFKEHRMLGSSFVPQTMLTKVFKELNYISKKYRLKKNDKKFTAYLIENIVKPAKNYIMLDEEVQSLKKDLLKKKDKAEKEALKKQIKSLENILDKNQGYLFEKGTPLSNRANKIAKNFRKLIRRPLPEKEEKKILQDSLYLKALLATEFIREEWEEKREEFKTLEDKYEHIQLNFMLTCESIMPTKKEKKLEIASYTLALEEMCQEVKKLKEALEKLKEKGVPIAYS